MALSDLFSPEVAAQDITEIVFVLDASGSMDMISQETIAGFNSFLDKQRQTTGYAYMTLVTFNTYGRQLYQGLPLAEVPYLNDSTYQPDGGTALLDAIGNQIISTNRRLQEMPPERRPTKVIFAIFTDGQENASRSFTREEIREMITEHESVFKWDVMFLGANQDAFAVGSTLGTKPGKALSWSATGDGVSGLFSAVGNTVSSYRASGAPENDQFFTEEDHATQQRLGAVASPLRA